MARSNSRLNPRVTKKRAESITKDYWPFFQHLTLFAGQELVRVYPPIMQGILIDRSSSDLYYPVGFIRVLCAPYEKRMMQRLEMAQRLHGKGIGQAVWLRDHERDRDKIARAMYYQFVPSLSEPLEPDRVYDLFCHRAAPTPPECYSLASLAAWLDRNSDVTTWTERYKTECGRRPVRPQREAEREFLAKLKSVLAAGQVRAFLENVVQEELAKLGFTP